MNLLLFVLITTVIALGAIYGYAYYYRETPFDAASSLPYMNTLTESSKASDSDVVVTTTAESSPKTSESSKSISSETKKKIKKEMKKLKKAEKKLLATPKTTETPATSPSATPSSSPAVTSSPAPSTTASPSTTDQIKARIAAEKKAFQEASTKDKAKKIVTAVALTTPVGLAAAAAIKLKKKRDQKKKEQNK